MIPIDLILRVVQIVLPIILKSFEKNQLMQHVTASELSDGEIKKIALLALEREMNDSQP